MTTFSFQCNLLWIHYHRTNCEILRKFRRGKIKSLTIDILKIWLWYWQHYCCRLRRISERLGYSIRIGVPGYMRRSEFNSLWRSDAMAMNSLNIGSVNGLMPDGTKPQPHSMLTNHQWDLIAFTWDQFHRKWSRNISLTRVWKLLI